MKEIKDAIATMNAVPAARENAYHPLPVTATETPRAVVAAMIPPKAYSRGTAGSAARSPATPDELALKRLPQQDVITSGWRPRK
jgi:hypothetical protein